jgi:hypothetical protein
MSEEESPMSDVPMFEGDAPDLIDQLAVAFEIVAPSDLLSHLDRRRPHSGQWHTAEGEAGAQILDDITVRDVYDAVIIAMFQSSGLSTSDYPASVYDLPLAEMDPLAIAQNVVCVIERRAGLPSNLGNPASRCVFCADEYPDLCPPHLHERGDQT